MKRYVRRALAFSLVFVCGVAVLFWDGRRIGRELDRYHGIPVFDNGVLFFRSHGRNYAPDGYYFGQKWQCVEFIKRFYYIAKHHRMPDVMGHARSFFDEAVPDGGLNGRRGLVQYRNGSTERPRPDDLVVFTDTKYGHVGIVTKAGESAVEIIQQNILGHTRQRLSLTVTNGHYFIASPRTPAGWLRLPNRP